MKGFASDPVHRVERPEDPGWYFWDETWSDRYGPYPTEEAARAALKQYGEELNNEHL